MDNWGSNGDNVENSQCGDKGLDSFNSLLWYNPLAANALSALNQQLNVPVEGQGQGQKEAWTQFVVEDKAEMKTEWIANSPVAQSIRSQEDRSLRSVMWKNMFQRFRITRHLQKEIL